MILWEKNVCLKQFSDFYQHSIIQYNHSYFDYLDNSARKRYPERGCGSPKPDTCIPAFWAGLFHLEEAANDIRLLDAQQCHSVGGGSSN